MPAVDASPVSLTQQQELDDYPMLAPTFSYPADGKDGDMEVLIDTSARLGPALGGSTTPYQAELLQQPNNLVKIGILTAALLLGLLIPFTMILLAVGQTMEYPFRPRG